MAVGDGGTVSIFGSDTSDGDLSKFFVGGLVCQYSAHITLNDRDCTIGPTGVVEEDRVRSPLPGQNMSCTCAGKGRELYKKSTFCHSFTFMDFLVKRGPHFLKSPLTTVSSLSLSQRQGASLPTSLPSSPSSAQNRARAHDCRAPPAYPPCMPCQPPPPPRRHPPNRQMCPNFSPGRKTQSRCPCAESGGDIYPTRNEQC